MIYPHIRWAIRPDMPAVLDIDRDSFVPAWTEEDFLKLLRNKDHICLVAEQRRDDKHDGPVVGFVLYQLQKERMLIHRMAVAPQYRRQGAGRRLVDKMTAKLSRRYRRHLDLLVSDNALGAHLFLRATGFRALRVVRGHFNGQDAYLFRQSIKEVADA